MPPQRSTLEQHDGDAPWSGYRWIGLVAGLAMLGVVAVAVYGLAVPEILTVEQAVVGLAATTVVIALGVLTTLVLTDRVFTGMQRHRNAIGAQQEGLHEAREEAWERHQEIESRRFGDRIDELDMRVEEVDDELAALTQRLRSTTSPSPFGDIHETGAIPGIQDEEASRLREIGVTDTEQLWMANAKRVAGAVDHEASTVRRWQQQAELLALPRVGPRSAQLLVEAGVRSIPELAGWQPDELLERLRGEHMRIDLEPEEEMLDPTHVDAWIENARDHDPTAYRVHRHRTGSRA